MDENFQEDEYRIEIQRLQRMMTNLNCEQKDEALSLRDFVVDKALGKGAYGNVYRVRSVRDGQDYALKQIIISSKNDGIPQSVLREITVMKHIVRQEHPNIVSLKAVFHQMDTVKELLKINMIMERCDWDLHTFLRDIPKKVPEHQIRHIAAQITQGLDFLHTQNIIHRDLKPQNILLNRDQTVKLADFGLSKEHSNTTAFTTLVVTLWYRAPEVLLQSYYTSSVDMWALGCIISEIYTREPLFMGQTEAEQLNEIFKKLGLPSSREWPAQAVISRDTFTAHKLKRTKPVHSELPEAARQFVQKCLKFDPIRRFSARVALGHEFLKIDKKAAAKISPAMPVIKKSSARVLKPLFFNQ